MSYAEELARVENAKGRVSLEPLFLKAYALRHDLVDPASSGAPSPVEALSDAEFVTTQGHLRGVLVNREEAVFAVPDAAFFEKLGERKGRTEDRLLLRLYHRTYENGAWPVYVRQQTDATGCTDFGPGNLTKLYGEWTHYQTLHPDRYRAVVDAEIERIADELTHAECACGPSGSVQSELRYFVHRHPGSPIAPAVRERLNELLHGKSRIRFNCVSG
ncbi:MAG TPA: hypothetical protein VE326_03660 [Candidatus Binatia bacterium]|nr:hypothetical protein [Candidatus Binatia bacterium]